MPNVYEEINRWATRSLSFWEQAALDRIIAGEQIDDEVVEELLEYLLEDAGLQDKKKDRPNLTNLALSAAYTLSENSRYRLARIHNLQNINALVPNQRLEFGKELTVIFGSNGSGKSGYARVIGSAAFTRGDKQILRNVTATQTPDGPLSADIDLVSEDGENVSIHYVVGEPCPHLRSFYVFDSTSVKNHLTKENPMSFSPAGLESLTSLVSVTDRVRKALEQKCLEKDVSKNIIDPLFIGDSKVKAYIKTLGASTDLAALEKLADVSDEEKARVAQLELQIAQIHSQGIQETIERLTHEIEDLETLCVSIRAIEDYMQSDEVQKVNGLIEEYNQCETTTRAASSTRSESFYPRRYDSYLWERFAHAAYELGRSESPTYPNNRDRCLLCGQPLSGEAKSLIERIWESVNSEASAKKQEIDNHLNACASTIRRLDFDILDSRTAAYRCIQRHDAEILKFLQANLQDTRRFCQQVQTSIYSHQPIKVDSVRFVGSEAVEKVIKVLKVELKGLVDQNTEQTLKDLEKEKLELQHRVLLANEMGAIKDFVQRAKWVKHASSSSVKRSSRQITQKYNELFDLLVTQRYIQLFEETLSKLKCPLRVRVETRGSKGETRKQIVLLRDDNECCSETTPDKVLSEGEQRAVALADFLTEVALNNHSAGIILDDPVTSLDFQWKETIARNIVEEARRQQVIVFTHDLHFLYCIKNFAEEQSIDLCGHWIQKRNDLPGWVFLNNSPVSEKDFKTSAKAKEYLKKLKGAPCDAEEEQHLLSSGFGALRTSYEAFIMFDLFGGVVLRFDERISGDRLKSVYIDEGIRDEVIDSIGRLSRYIEAHLHSDAFATQKPTAKMLEEEITRFDGIKTRHKDVKKQHGIKD